MIYIALYRGKSWISKVIRWFTWSEYSHVAVAEIDGESVKIWEAWRRGVRMTTAWRDGHEPGTRIDLYSFKTWLSTPERDTIVAALTAEIGKPYDWHGILSFLYRRRMQREGAWFCSELAAHACRLAGRPLQNCEPWRVSPKDVANSPLLKPDGTVVTE